MLPMTKFRCYTTYANRPRPGSCCMCGTQDIAKLSACMWWQRPQLLSCSQTSWYVLGNGLESVFHIGVSVGEAQILGLHRENLLSFQHLRRSNLLHQKKCQVLDRYMHVAVCTRDGDRVYINYHRSPFTKNRFKREFRHWQPRGPPDDSPQLLAQLRQTHRVRCRSVDYT